MDPSLRFQPDQQGLIPVQQAELERFAAECIRKQLATSPVDEQEAEAFLRQAYEAAALPAPPHIRWVDGPGELLAMAALATLSYSLVVLSEDATWSTVPARARSSAPFHDLRPSVRASLEACLIEAVHTALDATFLQPFWTWVTLNSERTALPFLRASIRSYEEAHQFVLPHFIAGSSLPKRAHALAHFTELVSGCWLSREAALIVRRPNVLSRDTAGRLHSASGKCLEYADSWGFYAWHGMPVPEKVILAPETLTGEDFLTERNLELRRVIQERMGERFVAELGGVVIEGGDRGTLYEVALLEDDPEGWARYVQVQDASTERQYLLRVPPWVETAAQAVAWSFGLSGEEYHPAQET